MRVSEISGVSLQVAASIPFRDLPTGRWARLCEAATDGVGSQRLRDLGLVPGTRVKVVRRAPLGDPVEIELRGYRLCLRGRQLEGLWVTLESEGKPS